MLRLGLGLLTLTSLVDWIGAIADHAGPAAMIEGAVAVAFALQGLAHPDRVVELLQSGPKAQLPVLAFVTVGAIDPGVQTHFPEVALAIVWVLALIVAPRWVALSIAISVAGYLIDLLCAGHSLHWIVLGRGQRAFVNQGIGFVGNGGVVMVLIAILRRHLASLPATLNAIRAGGPSLTPMLALAAREPIAALPRPDVRGLTDTLTETERQVLDALAGGLTPKQFAFERGIKLPTVRTHIANAKRKVGARTLEQLVAVYVQASRAR